MKSQLVLATVCAALIASTAPASALASTNPNAVAPSNVSTALGTDLVAGYRATPNVGVNSATMSFKVPEVTCANGSARAVTIGLGDVETLQAPRLRAQAVLSCTSNASPTYSITALTCAHSAEPLATKAGHHVTVSLTRSPRTITMKATDDTTGDSVVASDFVSNCDLNTILLGAFPVFDPTLLPVPDFHKAKPYHTTVNGVELAGKKVNGQSDIGIKTTKLMNDAGASFKTAAHRQSGDRFSLLFVVHCCLGPSSPTVASPSSHR